MAIDNLYTIDWILLGGLAAVFVAQIVWYAWLLCAPARERRKAAAQRRKTEAEPLKDESRETWPGVSVLICARNEGVNLSDYLPALLTQDYPAFEVIVVDDGSEDNTREVIDYYMLHDPRLHTTFVPREARVGSTKKLALTLAAKAAHYDYLLLTDADCVPESNQWIRSMMQGFGEGENERTKDIVLGYGAYFYAPGHVNRLVRYDTLFNGLHYLGAALCGLPYMGVGRNLAYRKSLFFESGGFSHLMANRAGDDDLLVNHLATRDNTAVVLGPESYTWSPAKRTLKQWWQQKRRHLSVSPSYKPSTRRRLLFEPLTRGLFYALLICAAVWFWPAGCQLFTLHSPLATACYPLLIVLGLFLVRWAVQTAVINVSARRMGQHGFNPLTVLWFDIVLPLVNLWMLVVPGRKTKW